MTAGLFRQLTDIQKQAARLSSGNFSIEDMTMFERYNEELKRFILTNTEDPDVIHLTHEIPNVLDVQKEAKKPLILIILLALISLGVSVLLISYVSDMRRNKLIQQNIQIARGKYASIEFLMKINS
jgi:hypothetical protein